MKRYIIGGDSAPIQVLRKWMNDFKNPHTGGVLFRSKGATSNIQIFDLAGQEPDIRDVYLKKADGIVIALNLEDEKSIEQAEKCLAWIGGLKFLFVGVNTEDSEKVQQRARVLQERYADNFIEVSAFDEERIQQIMTDFTGVEAPEIRPSSPG
jgi:hypothetical protein